MPLFSQRRRVRRESLLDPAVPMRPFPGCDRARGSSVSNCPSPECSTCPKGEFSKRTEGDRAERTRTAAGCPSLGHLSWARKKGDEKDQITDGGLLDAVWCVRHLSAAVAGCGRSFLGGSSLGPVGMQRRRSLFTAFPATPAARSGSLASAPGLSVVHRPRAHASTQGLRVRAVRRRGKAKQETTTVTTDEHR